MNVIKSRNNLNEFIDADLCRYDSIPTFFNILAGNIHNYRLIKFLSTLRHLEYYYNNRDTFLGKIMYV